LCWKAHTAEPSPLAPGMWNRQDLWKELAASSLPATAIRIFDSWKNFKQARESCYKLEQECGIVLRCKIVRSLIHGRPQSPHRRTRGNSSSSPVTRSMPSYQEDRSVIWSSQRLWRGWPKTSRERNTDNQQIDSCRYEMRETIPIPTRLSRTVHRSLRTSKQVVELLAIEWVHH